MEEIAFATRTSKEDYELFFNTDIEALYELSREKGVFPVRSGFFSYLEQAKESSTGFISLLAPEYEEDYFEVLVGNSRAVAQHLFEEHLASLKEREVKLSTENKYAASLLKGLAEGNISVDQIKKAMSKVKGAVNA